ncbi:hypothetical protein RDI58_013207 [Solanum bulbocastanum]|uniref:RING-type E3 ubiquitin transferase n=1 Tax=Solanum bulbocastanum TaxID=147425 RepID=A0AAN8TJ46_SOLBU
MHKSILMLLLLSLNVKAEDLPTSSSQDVVSSFQPSLAVVIGVLLIMFSLTFLLLLYAKFCHTPSSHIQDGGGLVRSVSRSSGIDKTVVESLPFFKFSLLRGSKQGLECCVCLSKFEDIEILRLIPMCKHAFHINCIDQWLEKHSTCPLCRHKISCQDLSLLTYSDSLRFLWSQSEELVRDDESNLEIYIEREENGSEELPIQEKELHRFNHRIIVSDVVLKNRWSNVTSSDLIFLNSEMLNGMTSNRFSSMDRNAEQSTVIEEEQSINIKDEMERKRLFDSKIKSKCLVADEKRSMSEIIVYSRFNHRNRELSVPDERRRKLWLPIARRTVKWFANRERTENTTQTLNV